MKEAVKTPIQKTTVSNPQTAASADVRTDLANVQKKLNIMYSKTKKQFAVPAKVILDNFLKGQPIANKITFGQGSQLNDVIITGLFNIYANSTQSQLQIRAKDTAKSMLNPIGNSEFTKRIIAIYNNSKFNKYPVKSIDATVKWALKKSYEMFFTKLWDLFLKNNINPDKTITKTGFIGLVYTQLTGGNGFRTSEWFAQYYNDYKKDPKRFQQINPADPDKQKFDRSSHTVSDIIKYVYSIGKKFDVKILDNFSAANKEIVDFLKKNVKNPRSWKVFDYVVNSKLDSEEIIDMDKKDFPNQATVTGAFRDLAVANKKATTTIDAIYKKYKLKLPPFSTWKTSDFNKAASDRGELKADTPEFSTDKKGNLGKIKYDAFGNAEFSTLKELRIIIRDLLKENYKQSII